MGAKGRIKEEQQLITWEQVCEATNYGYDVYRWEIGSFPINKAFNSPLRKDRHASFGINKKEGVWLWKDLSSGDSGNCVQFIQKKYNLSFYDAMNKIAWDFGIQKKEGDVHYKPVKIDWKPPVFEEREIPISFSSKKWGKGEHKFWEGTGVNEQHCRKYETYAVKDLAVNRRKVYIRPGEVVWAYYAQDIDKAKIYFPEREKGSRFKGNVPGDYLWNIENVQQCDRLFVQKSMKDLLINTLYTKCVIATQNESAQNLLEYNYDRIENISEKKIICFGSDFQGWHESLLITYLTGWDYMNTPNHLLPDINDLYGFSKLVGYEEVGKYLKSKNLI